jgi:hypothetical protein
MGDLIIDNHDKLTPEIKLNFLNLRNYLSEKNWQYADLQTRKLMLVITGANLRRDILLTQKDLHNFPCKYLDLINKMWLKYSNYHFGFSLINQIYLDSDRNYKLLAEKVGWQKNNQWIKTENINFSLNAPKGHLPLTWLIPTTFSTYWSSRFASAGWGLIFKRMAECKIL